MLDKDLIKRKLALNQKELERLKNFEHLTIEEIAKDSGEYAACERYLERLIGRAIDINSHILAEIGSAEHLVTKYRDTFLVLAKFDVYTEEFAEKIAPSAGLRNALVHEYNNIDQKMLEKSIGEAIKEYAEYAKYILAFVEKE